MTYPLQEKLDAIEREIKYRLRVYPRLIENGKISSEFADKQVAIMRAIADDYRMRIQEEERLI